MPKYQDYVLTFFGFCHVPLHASTHLHVPFMLLWNFRVLGWEERLPCARAQGDSLHNPAVQDRFE